MHRYFLITVYTCENVVFLENLIRISGSYVSRDMVLNIVANGDVPEEILPLFYTTKEFNFKGMIQSHELEQKRRRRE